MSKINFIKNKVITSAPVTISHTEEPSNKASVNKVIPPKTTFLVPI